MASIINVDQIRNAAGTTALTIGTDGRPYPKAGGIVQVQYGQLTTFASQALTANTYTKLTAFPSATITPASTSSILKIDVMWNGEFGVADNANNNVFVLYRDSTLIKGNTESGAVMAGMWGASTNYYAADADSTAEHLQGTYFDEPSTTSAITYHLGIKVSSSDTIYTNRVVSSTYNASGYERFISNITVTEIAG